jgi:site-specific DNA-methyltransferase (adenine-specific)
MGQTWDGGDVAFRAETWAEVLRVLKPGGHLAAFGGTRTYHRLACAIEDAGFEIRDQLAWVYGSGFPKSLDVSKAIDKAAGAKRGRNPDTRNGPNTRQETKGQPRIVGGYASDAPLDGGAITPEAEQWQGWGTALKPSWEPICLARKPLESTVAANVLKHGTGALNIDGCRVEAQGRPAREANYKPGFADVGVSGGSKAVGETDLGRWPANLCHDGSDEVLAGFPVEAGGRDKREGGSGHRPGGFANVGADSGCNEPNGLLYGDSGSAARFFYCAEAGKLDRLGSKHPTVKPVALKRWLVRLITPRGGVVLDPFAGCGSTGIAAFVEGMDSILIELRQEAADDIQRRLDFIRGLGRTKLDELASGHDDEQKARAAGHGLPLFAT